MRELALGTMMFDKFANPDQDARASSDPRWTAEGTRGGARPTPCTRAHAGFAPNILISTNCIARTGTPTSTRLWAFCPISCAAAQSGPWEPQDIRPK